MKKKLRKTVPFMLSAMVVASMAVTPVMAAGTNDAPKNVESAEVSGFMTEIMALKFSDTDWLNAVNGVSVNGTEYTKGTINSWGSNGNLWEVNSVTGAYGDYTALKLVNPSTYPATIKISANGYKDLTIKVKKDTSVYPYTYKTTVVPDSGDTTAANYTATVQASENGKLTISSEKNLKEGDVVTVTATPDENYETDTITVTGESGKSVEVTSSGSYYTFKMPSENVKVSAVFKVKPTSGNKKADINLIGIDKDFFGSHLEFTFNGIENYVKSIMDIKVNGTSWTEKTYNVSLGGQYYKDIYNNKLIFAAKDYSSSPTIPVLKSGDVITISANGYDDLTLKFVIDKDGNASLEENDGKGDPYDLHVKIDGSFEAAVSGQKDYDGVSSASVGGASSNNNSSVKVYGALVSKDTKPTESDWEESDNFSKIKLDGNKCKVNIVPDTENGTPVGSDSGMEGVYMTISSSLTLKGTPKDPGTYLISVSVTDKEGRTATSNALPFRIYSGNESLSERLTTDNLKRYNSGLYAWDIMEPWAIKNFGSNVEGEKESVRVPEELEAWFGSHESGKYGYLGYDLPWKEVINGDIPQTLYIPKGCNLTLVNMEVLSSVRIVVENGGKLTLSGSVIQGIVDVRDGGTFSMNYDSYSKTFTTGSSICGQLRLEDGATLENAAIYSHANYLANGNLTDRNTSAPVVTATGNTTIKGHVFIKGADDGDGIGQTALQTDGTLKLEDGAVLVATGGEGIINENAGGTAIDIKDGRITGNGKLVAIGGKTFWGDGGNAVIGNGTIETASAFLQGATGSAARKREAGKAIGNNIKVITSDLHIKDGEVSENYGTDDILSDLYWKNGIDSTPPLDKYITAAVKNNLSLEGSMDKIYDGKASDTPVVKSGNNILTEGTHYLLTFKDSEGNELSEVPINSGTYTITVSGLGTYAGMVLHDTYTISPDITEPPVISDSENNITPSDSKTANNDTDNSYKNISLADNNGTDKNTIHKTNYAESVEKNQNIPKTGDHINTVLWIILSVISLGVLAGVGAVIKKRK